MAVWARTNRPGSWGVIYADHTKRRHTTYFDSQEQAEAYAEVKRKQLFEEGLMSLALPDIARHEATLAMEVLKPFGKGILEAARFHAQHLQENEKTCTVTELIEMFLWDMEGNEVSKRHLAAAGEVRQGLWQADRRHGNLIGN